jgi:hypothetical protein
LNDVSVDVADIEKRTKIHSAMALYKKIQRVAGHYTISEGG